MTVSNLIDKLLDFPSKTEIKVFVETTNFNIGLPIDKIDRAVPRDIGIDIKENDLYIFLKGKTGN